MAGCSLDFRYQILVSWSYTVLQQLQTAKIVHLKSHNTGGRKTIASAHHPVPRQDPGNGGTLVRNEIRDYEQVDSPG